MGNVDASLSGYSHPLYAASLADFGNPILLPRARSYVLKRQIGEQPLWDAMAPYPLLMCEDWSGLTDDLAGLSGEIVSITAVADPLGDHDDATLRAAFPDLMRPYKDHYVVDLTVEADDHISSHHRRNTRWARERVAVERCPEPKLWLSEWTDLYRNLVDRHQVSGVADFSPRAFELQFDIPGLQLFRATASGTTVGMLMWYATGDRAYYHLGAYNDDGYRLKASFALFDTAIEWFRNGDYRRLLLGAGAGVVSEGADGLSRFKRGWATGSATAYLCGRVLDDAAYARLSRKASNDGFFPAYRPPGWYR